MRIYKTNINSDVAKTQVNIAVQWSNMGLFEKALNQIKKVCGKLYIFLLYVVKSLLPIFVFFRYPVAIV